MAAAESLSDTAGVTREPDERIRELADRTEIVELLVRYCRGVDRCDPEIMRSVYHEDGWDEHGVFSGRGWDFAEWVPPRMREMFESTVHTLPNIHVEIRGDRAIAESTVIGYHVPKGKTGEELEIFSGRYLDRIERRNGAWKIAHRVCVNDFTGVLPASGVMKSQAQYIPARRDRDDQSYSLHDFLG